jgi:hypothetical protein
VAVLTVGGASSAAIAERWSSPLSTTESDLYHIVFKFRVDRRESCVPARGSAGCHFQELW